MKDHIPKSLNCGHTFCNICLENIDTSGAIKCPNCKKEQKIPNGVESLGTNHMVTSLLDYGCEQCQSYGNTSRCPHCQHMVCKACLDDHRQLGYKNTVLASLDKVLGMKEKVDMHLPFVVSQITGMIEDLGKFCEKSRELIHSNPSSDQLKQVDDGLSSYMERLQEIDEFVSVDWPKIVADVPGADVDVTHKYVTYHDVPKRVFGREGSGPDELSEPCAVAIDNKSGKLYVADTGNSRICIYEDSGYLSSFDIKNRPKDISITFQGNLLASFTNDSLIIYTMDGSVVRTWGKYGKKPGQFSSPRAVATDSDGRIYVCDTDNHRAQMFDETGSSLGVFGTTRPGILHEPESVAIHPQNGDIYVADNKSHQILIFTNDGQYKSNIGKVDIPGNSFCPWYVAFSSDVLLAISDYANHCIYIMQDKKYIQKIGNRGTAAGEFNWPRGLTFAKHGDLIVCDQNNHRIQVFSRK